MAGIPANHHVQFLLTEYDPGADSAPEGSAQTHRGDDYGYILEGTLTIEIDGVERTLSKGESIQLSGRAPHRLRNRSKRMVKAIWFVVE
ncbi:cupin domain-containing protein [Rhodococcus sp. ABRD24]|uniref:cupin domain-containing protein n=1 Tax=Rhodococcus sp. ABRD24 TaxID=2507582 RepID=UPI001F612BCF|nr:cupin domain-containing protein [Rhodococcus sp. ABRD24]